MHYSFCLFKNTINKHKLFLHFVAFLTARFIKRLFSTLSVSNNSLPISLFNHPKKCFPPSPPVKLFLNSILTMIDCLYSFSLLCAISCYNFFTWLLENHISLLLLLLHWEALFFFFFNYVLLILSLPLEFFML